MIINKNKLYYIIQHFIRPIWTLGILRLVFYIRALVMYMINKNVRIAYSINKKRWDSILTIQNLNYYFHYDMKIPYKDIDLCDSKPTRPKQFSTIFDRDLTKFEFLCNIGKCDDSGYFYAQKLNQIGYITTQIIGFKAHSNNSKFTHYETLFKLNRTDYMIANYGHNIRSKSEHMRLHELKRTWSNKTKSNVNDELITWECDRSLEWLNLSIQLFGIFALTVFTIIVYNI